MKNIFDKIRIFLEMIQFEHSIFALPFAYLGLFFAERKIPSLFLFFWITAAMVSFRTMAMGLNRLFDRSIDAKNPRTKHRALPQKKIQSESVWLLSSIALTVFEVSAYQLGAICFWLSPIPVVLAVVYPLSKRFTWLSHFLLGLILGIAPYGAWIASRQSFSWIPAFLTLGVTVWVAGFDMVYALQDVSFDKAHGLFSFPARFGQARTLQMTKLLHIVSIFCWGMAGFLNGANVIYWMGLVLVAYFLVREHHLIHAFGMEKINEAFFLMNAVVSITLFAAAFLDLMF